MRKILYRLNLSRVVCNHLLSKTHTENHRMVVGVGFMVVGVLISKIETTIVVLHFLFDGIGYGIHGIGVTPFIEKLTDIGAKARADADKVEQEVVNDVNDLEK